MAVSSERNRCRRRSSGRRSGPAPVSVAGLFPEPAKGGGIFAPVEFVAEGFGGGAFSGRAAHDVGQNVDGFERPLAAVAGGGGVGDDADPVLVATPGHPDIELLDAGDGIGEQDGPIDGDPFRLVDGHGIRQGNMFGGIVGRQHDPALAVEVGDDQGAVVPAGIDVSAVTVADPQPPGGKESAVVAGSDDLVAPANDLAADCARWRKRRRSCPRGCRR
ncbi:MAG: hypothetical protein ACRDZ3_14125 [Acidimicrobiia bacterium]